MIGVSSRPVYAFSHLAEESPLPEGKDYHVRIPVVKTDGGNRTCSVGLKLPAMKGEEDFLTLHPEDECQNPVRGNKVRHTQNTLIFLCTHTEHSRLCSSK